MIYEVTYKKDNTIWTSRMSGRYLCEMENDPSVEILSIG